MVVALMRLGSLALFAGTLLFGVASLFHPPTVNPWDPGHALAEATQARWMLDHWTLLTAVLLIHLGLLALHGTVCGEAWVRSGGRSRGWRDVALAFAAASLTLWTGIFLFEVTGWPVLAGAQQVTGVLTVARALWALSLSLGYAAALFLGLAVLGWSLELIGRGHARERSGRSSIPAWFARLGVVAGAITAVVQPAALGLPRLAPWLLAPASLLLGAGFLAAAWVMWQGAKGTAVHKEPAETGGGSHTANE